jgi:hypothetical protein
MNPNSNKNTKFKILGDAIAYTIAENLDENNPDIIYRYQPIDSDDNNIVNTYKKMLNEKRSMHYGKDSTGELLIDIPTEEKTSDNTQIDNNNNNNNNNNIDNKPYESVNHPTHYNKYDKEVIDMMVNIWGPEETKIFCKLNAFKYRMRMGTKPTSPIDEDLKKEQWYLKKMKEL